MLIFVNTFVHIDFLVANTSLCTLLSPKNSLVEQQSAKGVVGWKAPPKPVRKEIVRQPTQTQADAAKRLSQGLSVAASAQRDAAVRQRNSGISSNLFHCSSSNFAGLAVYTFFYFKMRVLISAFTKLSAEWDHFGSSGVSPTHVSQQHYKSGICKWNKRLSGGPC